MKTFIEKLLEIERSHPEPDIEEMNIFNILFHGYEEVRLHSRFISYLLSLKNQEYLKIFVRDTLKLEEFEIDKCEVIPNEHNKSEYENIDILIYNGNQAIIIENKIHADDVIHRDAKKGYQGQLERYYNTLTNGKDKNGKSLPIKCEEENTYIYYLTLYKKPSQDTIGELFQRNKFISEKHVLNYYDIQKWLGKCIKMSVKNSFLATIITQYLNLIKRMTADNDKVLEIIDLIAENQDYWRSAYIFSKYFKDIKWHTIHRFFTELSERFQAEMPDEDVITKVAHNGTNMELKISFDYKGKRLQIVNDIKGFTFGILTPDQQNWGYFSDTIKNIRFSDFSNETTFRLINSENRKEIIDKIVEEVSQHHSEEYRNLKGVFPTAKNKN